MVFTYNMVCGMLHIESQFSFYQFIEINQNDIIKNQTVSSNPHW